MTGELLALGANHKTAPLPLRERIALPDGRAARVLAELVGHEALGVRLGQMAAAGLVAPDELLDRHRDSFPHRRPGRAVAFSRGDPPWSRTAVLRACPAYSPAATVSAIS